MKKILLFSFLFMVAGFLWAEEEKAVGTPYVYKTVDGEDLHLYVTRPEPSTGSDPVFVFFHGGGWVSGHPRVFNDQVAVLSKLGMTCVLVQYRFLHGLETPEICIQDAKSAIRWVRIHSDELGVDPNRIVAAGASAGGHMAAATGMIEGSNDPGDDLSVSAKPQAIILYNAVIDNGPTGYGYKRVKDRYLEFSPLHNIRPGVPPVLFLLGSKDKLIPVATGELFKQKMDEAGVRCDLIIADGMPHSFYHKRYGGEEGYQIALNATVEFLTSLGWITEGNK